MIRFDSPPAGGELCEAFLTHRRLEEYILRPFFLSDPRRDARVDAVGSHIPDGLAVDLQRTGAVKAHLDVMARQDLDHFRVLYMAAFENGREYRQRLDLAAAVHDAHADLALSIAAMPPP